MIYRIGTAGWSIPKAHSGLFESIGSHLEKYASKLGAVEINSSFYNDHQAKSYRRWAESVPDGFQFSVKLSKVYTHDYRLEETSGLSDVLEGISELREKWKVLLVQLPPSLDFNAKIANAFFREVRKNYLGHVAFEARHVTWTNEDAQKVLAAHEISSVIADPNVLPETGVNATSLRYYRLHGSPEMYRSDYSPAALSEWEKRLRADEEKSVWCIFDNTTFGHATANAVQMHERLNPMRNDRRQPVDDGRRFASLTMYPSNGAKKERGYGISHEIG